MIIDAHTHISDSDYGNFELYQQESDKAGIDKSILFPGGSIDVRKMSRYISMKEMPPKAPVNNKLILELVKKYPKKYKAFMGINPTEKSKAEILNEFEKGIKEDGFVGLKLSPTSYGFAFNHEVVQELINLCGIFNIPVYAHTVFSKGATTDDYAACAKAFPNTNFIIGHMGFGTADIDAVMHAKNIDNIFLETSGGSSIIIKQALKIVGDEKIIFGSEFPMHSIKSELIKIQELDQCDLNRILYQNIQKLVNI